MDWIKKNPHLLALILVALGLAAASTLAILQAKSFNERFVPLQTPVTQGSKLPQQDAGPIELAQKAYDKPQTWAPAKDGPQLFVSERYMLNNQGALEKPGDGELWKDSLTKKGIPNSWLLTNRLPLFDSTVPRQDADGDGFYNEDEWREGTDPQNKESHPPYYKKLWVKRYIRVPFRLKFNSYDGDPKKDKIADMSFQINTLDLRKPSQFLKIGDVMPGTKFKLDSFKFKMDQQANGLETDISELTVVDVETGNPVVLVLNKVTDSPDSYALFTYLWAQPAKDIQVKKLQEFVLLPNTQERYKLLDISETEASVQLPSGDKVTISRLPDGYQ